MGSEWESIALAMSRALVLLLLCLVACERREPPSASERPPAPAPIAPEAPASALASVAPAAAPVAELVAVPIGSAARPPKPAPERVPSSPKALVQSPPRPTGSAHAGFRGPVDASKDSTWLERLAAGPIDEIARNSGGATLTLRVKFVDGSRAVFKPEQKHSASNHRGEIAAYHVDRLLGFGRTAAVVGRRIGYDHLIQQLEHSGADDPWLARFRSEVVSRDGWVAGAMIAWHSGRLASAEPPNGWTASLRSAVPIDETLSARLPEWTDLMVFDAVIGNTDRWSGGNVLTLGPGGPLIFLDNASSFLSFEPAKGPVALLEPICRFRRATVEALASVGPAVSPDRRLGAELGRSLARDPLAPVLGPGQLDAVDRRVARVLEHVATCSSELGEDVVLLP